VDGLLQIRDLGLHARTEKAIRFQASPRDLKPRRGNKTSPVEARGVEPSLRAQIKRPRREGSGSGSTYRFLEVDAALDDLPAAPRHDGDLHPGRPALAAATSEARVWRCGRGGGGEVRRKRRRRGGEGVDGGRWRI
jgi:hypothetical protein